MGHHASLAPGSRADLVRRGINVHREDRSDKGAEGEATPLGQRNPMRLNRRELSLAAAIGNLGPDHGASINNRSLFHAESRTGQDKAGPAGRPEAARARWSAQRWPA